MDITTLVQTYLPGFEWLVITFLAHILLSTWVHIKAKDFSFAEWPKFLSMWLLFMVALLCVNGVVSVALALPSAVYLSPVVLVLQAAVYASYFTYYLDNFFRHASLLGLPVAPSLVDFIKSMTGKILKPHTDSESGGNE